mmetsp:Transcript_23950/g.50091  ORF Transcript_23950/g.50091 Transcript_23950/m.50091 type:complete len:292 (-) Transcript_23950:662-1537(-)
MLQVVREQLGEQLDTGPPSLDRGACLGACRGQCRSRRHGGLGSRPPRSAPPPPDGPGRVQAHRDVVRVHGVAVHPPPHLDLAAEHHVPVEREEAEAQRRHAAHRRPRDALVRGRQRQRQVPPHRRDQRPRLARQRRRRRAHPARHEAARGVPVARAGGGLVGAHGAPALRQRAAGRAVEHPGSLDRGADEVGVVTHAHVQPELPGGADRAAAGGGRLSDVDPAGGEEAEADEPRRALHHGNGGPAARQEGAEVGFWRIVLSAQCVFELDTSLPVHDCGDAFELCVAEERFN